MFRSIMNILVLVAAIGFAFAEARHFGWGGPTSDLEFIADLLSATLLALALIYVRMDAA